MTYMVEVFVWYVIGVSSFLASLHAFSTMLLVSKNPVKEWIFYVSMVSLTLVWISGLHLSMLSNIQLYVVYVIGVVFCYIYGSNVYFDSRVELHVRGEYYFEGREDLS